MDELLTATCLTAIALAEAQDGDGWIQLIPAGTFGMRDGRGPFRNDQVDQVIQASRALRMDLPIDYDHATDLAPAGTQVLAAGWIKELQARQDGIWGRVEWTERAAQMLKAKEYRYLSPVFNYRKEDGRITRILRAALTNNPAIELKAVASQEKPMDELLKALRAALGLKDDADQVAVMTAIAALKKGASLVAIAKAAGLADDADATAIAAAVGELGKKAAAAEPDPAKFVPMATFTDLQTSFNKLRADISEEKATAAVDAAVKAGKLQPAQRDWALGYAKKDPEAFAAFVDKQPVIVAAGGKGPTGQPPAAGAALTADELAVCKAMGLDPEAFKKTRDADLKEAV
jgi:phage I-like protein